MRIIVMGTGPFALPTAQRLVELGHHIPLVVTRPLPDPPPKKLPPRPIADWATEQTLPLFEPVSINTAESIETLKSFQAELFFVCDYGQILSNDCLSAAQLGGINLHGSLLPRHRGAAPVQWALLSGDKVAGVTVIHMTPRLDAGPALAVESLEILPDETAEGLEPRLAAIGVRATERALELLETWDQQSPIGTIQDKSLVTKAPRFAKPDGQLDFRLPAEYLVRLLRACQPWPGTFAELEWASGKNIRLLIRAARSIDPAIDPTNNTERISSTEQIGLVRVFDSASVLNCENKAATLDWSGCWKTTLAVETASGLLLISRVQPAGKREMDVAEF
ncbi:MAG: methionyl-tRNA formyltransferase [Pirellulales bacterium]